MNKLHIVSFALVSVIGSFMAIVLAHPEPAIRNRVQLDPALETWDAGPEMNRAFPYYMAGYDDENRPIWVVEFGKWNIRRVIDQGGEPLQNLSRYIDQAFMRLSKSIEMANSPDFPVTDGVGIFDLENYDIFQLASVPTLQFIIRKAREIEPTTPHMEKGFFLNVSFVAQTFLNFLKPVLGAFFAKSEFYGTNRSRWIPDLIKKLPRDQLPEWYGGFKNYRPVAAYG